MSKITKAATIACLSTLFQGCDLNPKSTEDLSLSDYDTGFYETTMVIDTGTNTNREYYTCGVGLDTTDAPIPSNEFTLRGTSFRCQLDDQASPSGTPVFETYFINYDELREVDTATGETHFLFVDPATGIVPMPLPAQSEIEDAMTEAISEWQGFSDFAPNISFSINRGNTDSIIQGDQSKGPREDLLAGTEIWTYRKDDGKIDLFGKTSIFSVYDDGGGVDLDVPWALDHPSPGVIAYDLIQVVSHEIGHTAGLGHNLVDTNSTMNAYAPIGLWSSRYFAGEELLIMAWLYDSTLYAQ